MDKSQEAPITKFSISDCRVAVIEDHVMFREAIQKFCTSKLGCTVVGVADCVADAVKLIISQKPSIVLLDLHLSGGDGFSVVEQVRRNGVPVAFIALSSHTDDYSTYRAERHGFMGWIDKNTEMLKVLGQALSMAADGKTYYSPSFLALRRERNQDRCSFVKRLTEKQRTVLGG